MAVQSAKKRPKPSAKPRSPRAPKKPRVKPPALKDKAARPFRFRPPKTWFNGTPTGDPFSRNLSNRLRHLYAVSNRAKSAASGHKSTIKAALEELRKCRAGEKARIAKLEGDIGEAQVMLLTAVAVQKWADRKIVDAIAECDQPELRDIDPAPSPYTETDAFDDNEDTGQKSLDVSPKTDAAA